MSTHKLVIAIDGPAASGKSTTARLVAERLGYLHLDTGAMYRAIAAKVLRNGVRPDDADAVAKLMESTSVRLELRSGFLQVLLEGRDVTGEIRRAAVTRIVSAVSSIPVVREAMVREQRRMGQSGGVVLEGRDIGTVVFPDADLKIYMMAGLRSRALRRQQELETQGIRTELDTLLKELEQRDKLDSTRDASPLRRAPDAIDLDTSDLTIEEQVEFVVRKAQKLIAQRSQNS